MAFLLWGGPPVHFRVWLLSKRMAAEALLVVLLAVSASGAQGQPGPESEPVTITVEGRLLSGPFTFAERRGGELLLPIVSIAEALGDQVQVDPVTRRIVVQRRTGVSASLDLATGQVQEQGRTVMLSTSALTTLPSIIGDPRSLLLPVELVSALLEATVVVDSRARTLRVLRDTAQVTVSQGGRFGFFDLYRTGYDYKVDLAELNQLHTLQLSSSARVFDGLATAQGHFLGNPQQRFLDFRQGRLTYDRPNGQRFMLGDLSTSGDLDVMATSTRGAWYRQPLGDSDVTAYAGLARSGSAPDPFAPVDPSGLNFDTPVVGAYYSFGRQRPTMQEQHLSGAAGGFWFSGPLRRAGLLASTFKYETGIHTFQAEAGVGLFDDLRPGAATQRSVAYLAGVTEAINPIPTLTLLAGFRHISQGFLSPSGSAVLQPMNLMSGGLNWRPFSWVSMSGSGRYLERLDLPGHPLDHDLTGAVGFNFGAPWPSLSISHSEGSQSEIGRRTYSVANLSGSWEGIDYLVNGTHSVRGTETPEQMVVVSAGRALSPALSLRATQSFSSRGAVSGGLDAFMPGFFTPRVSVSVGLGYAYTGVHLAPTAHLALNAQLPWKQNLSFGIQQTEFGATGVVQLSGPLWDPPGTTVPSRYSVDQLGSLGTFSGRVFQDVDLDGEYRPGVDRVLSGVQVLVDGSNMVVTDESGEYRIPNVAAGEHTVFLNLLTVRADLSLLSNSRRLVALPASGETVVHFRLVRTGRVSGTVWQDDNGNGEVDEGEPLLGQIRVVSGQRDTLTNEDGGFVLGDLPQGSHRMAVDERTLPEGLRAKVGVVNVEVKPPRETRGVLLPVQPLPKEIEIREF